MNPLLAISPGDNSDRMDWLAALGAVGLQAVLLREPQLPEDAFVALVEAAIACVPEVVLHDKHPAARRVARAHGLVVHLADGVEPPDQPFAQSAHDSEGVMRALSAGARYVTLSPVWSPFSKPTDRRITLGLDGFLSIAADKPVLALGGVTPDRLRALRQRGATGAAVLGALHGPPAVAAAALSAFLDALNP